MDPPGRDPFGAGAMTHAQNIADDEAGR